MIIQCGQCATKFRIDDARVTEKGVKVRCAKCKHVFIVSKPGAVAPEEIAASMSATAVSPPVPDVTAPPASIASPRNSVDETAEASFATKLDESVSAPMTESLASGEHEHDEPLPETPLPSVEREPASMAEPESVTAPDQNDEIASDVETSPTPASATDFFFDEPEFFPGGHRKYSARHSASPDEALFDRNEFLSSSAESEASTVTDRSVISPEIRSERSYVQAPADVEPSAAPEVPAHSDKTTSQTSLDAERFSATALPPLPDPALPTTGAADERTVLPAAALTAAGAATGQNTSPSSAAFTVEPPPSSTVRRQQAGSGSWLWWVLLVVVLGALAFYLYPRFADTAAPVTSQGGLTISAAKPSFVKNSEGIEVLLLEGEAVNGFRTARQSIRVKGMVFAADGRVVAEKTALCGTSLTREQVAAMPLEQVLTAQSNPGSATSPTAPGAAVSCIVVLDNVPTEGKDFALEVIDSVEVAPGN